MRTVAEYRQFAESCRQLAQGLTNPKDRHAVELMAEAWAKVADEREEALNKGEESPRP